MEGTQDDPAMRTVFYEQIDSERRRADEAGRCCSHAGNLHIRSSLENLSPMTTDQTLTMMKTPEHVVAMHEAGHTAVALSTEVADTVVEVRLFVDSETSDWAGGVEFSNDSNLTPLEGICRVATGFAGPLTQLKFFPETFPPELLRLIKEGGGLLRGVAIAQSRKLHIETNWGGDLNPFHLALKTFTIPTFQHELSGYFQIEEQVNAFLATKRGEILVRTIADELMKKRTIRKSDLAAFRNGADFSFCLPADLPINPTIPAKPPTIPPSTGELPKRA
jgi:hypothetical protein